MKAMAGLWIDHRQAILVTLADKGETVQHILSEVERQPRRSGDSPLRGSFESIKVHADDSRQREFTGQLNVFYDQVRVKLDDVAAVLIFGPGEAKGELVKRLEENNHRGLAITVEPADKMTDRQVAAKTRLFFSPRKMQGAVPNKKKRKLVSTP